MIGRTKVQGVDFRFVQKSLCSILGGFSVTGGRIFCRSNRFFSLPLQKIRPPVAGNPRPLCHCFVRSLAQCWFGNGLKTGRFGLEIVVFSPIFGLEMDKKSRVFDLEMVVSMYLCI